MEDNKSQTLRKVRAFVDLNLNVKKGIFFLYFACSTYLLSAQSNRTFTVLNCNTWGPADWSKLHEYLDKSGKTIMPSIERERDQSIQHSIPISSFTVYKKEIYLRWLLSDTTLYYDIRISNEEDELIYKTTTNGCGLKIPMDVLEEYKADFYVVHINRNINSNKEGFNWGYSIVLQPLSTEKREKISNEIAAKLNGEDGKEKLLVILNYFIEKKLYLDALSVLENLIELYPNDASIIKKYWEVVNDIHIKFYSK
jgi:hypothetical protein